MHTGNCNYNYNSLNSYDRINNAINVICNKVKYTR